MDYSFCEPRLWLLCFYPGGVHACFYPSWLSARRGLLGHILAVCIGWHLNCQFALKHWVPYGVWRWRHAGYTTLLRTSSLINISTTWIEISVHLLIFLCLLDPCQPTQIFTCIYILTHTHKILKCLLPCTLQHSTGIRENCQHPTRKIFMLYNNKRRYMNNRAASKERYISSITKCIR